MLKSSLMRGKAYPILLVAGILMMVSFTSGILYESWQEDKNTTDLDRPLALLLARPSDFEITGSQWLYIEYNQSYYEPRNKGVLLHYEIVKKHFSTGFPETDASFNVSHEIKRYAPAELPETTWIDDTYFGDQSRPEMEVRLLKLKELDENSRALCVLSKESTSITCLVESKYNEIISTFAFYGYNMEETQIIGFITPALRNFYERLSKSSIK